MLDSSLMQRLDTKFNEQLDLIRRETEDKYNHNELHLAFNGLKSTLTSL